MTVDAIRFDAEVFAPSGESLGEARFWGAGESGLDGSSWCGWMRVTDLGTNDLPPGRYHLRAFDGWQAEFETLVSRPSRVFEIDLIPFDGIGDVPWPPDDESRVIRYRPLWNETPPRSAHDRSYFAELSPLGLAPTEGLLPPG
jgi:hypothetical protein